MVAIVYACKVIWRLTESLMANRNSTWLSLLWIGALFYGVSGCEKAVELSPLPADAVVLAFGDSLTYGTGTNAKTSYPRVLEELIGREVINAGIPGETTKKGVQRLPMELEEYQPALVILMEGGNDFLRRYPPKETRENLRRMIRQIRASGAEVLLVGVPAPGLMLSSAELYEELAQELDVPYLDGVMADILSERELKSDPIHPNGEGYRLFAEAVTAFLRERGAIR